uniref:Integrase catalytic domain-containing protein n=1 Tax=Fagus sylvatica TaxID=28930 RepID=A0A2N9FX44_FAGSY
MPRSVSGPSRPAESPARQVSGPSRRQLEIPERPMPAESQAGQAPTPSRPKTSTESGRGESSVEVTPPRAQRSLIRSPSAESRADDSERVIAALRQEVDALKKAAQRTCPQQKIGRGKISIRVNKENSGASRSAHYEDWAESPSIKEKAISSAETSVTVREMRRKDGRSDKDVGGPHDRSSLPPIVPKKKLRRGEQGAVWKALDLISSSPFTDAIESAELPERFTAPRLEIYNGRTDPVAHIDHYHHRMALWRYKDPLIQMAEVFVGRFITNSRRSRGLDKLMVIRLGTNESLKDYSARFWETYNDINGCAEDTALQAFKLGLPPSTGLRQSLTKCPPTTLKKLMDRVERFVRVEEDGGNTNAVVSEVPVSPPISRPQARTTQTPKARSAPTSYAAPSFKAFQMVFKEPIHRLLDKIKGKPFFVWPSKLIGDPEVRNQNLYCFYHRDKGHLTENCHKYKAHLEQLVTAGHLSDYVDSNPTGSKARGTGTNRSGTQGPAPAGVIHVIHNPACTSILPTSFRSDMQKASHLRRSYGIVDYAHLVSTSCSGAPVSSAHQVVSFSDEDLADVQMPHNDPLVITLRFGDYDVQRVLVDQGSFAEIMYKGLYEKLGLKEADLANFTTPVFGFTVIRGSSPYNAIVGRDWLHRMKAVPSTLHQKLRFPTEEGVMEVNGDQAPAAVAEELAADDFAVEKDPEKVYFDPSEPEFYFLIGTNLSMDDRQGLVTLLMEFREVFAWSVYEAPGVSLDLACHSLNISVEAKPVSQKRRKLAPERAEIVAKEVERLLEANAIRSVQYPTWLSNTVVVRKKNEKWRVCVDFTDLNKACPKDPFPLPRIDQLVDSASGHERMSFLDAFKGYHQIPMAHLDQEKMAFITPTGIYCYRVMPFGLKNAGATYQRMVTEDLREVLEILRATKLRLNATKCLFGVSSGKFLGHMISYNGVEANPDQISALLNLQPPKDAKQVQRLTGMIAALGRFISRSADRCRPFFQLLGKKRKFLWDQDCSAAFEGIKAYLSSPPCLSIPCSGEPLFLYLAVSEHAVSAVLIRETNEGQRPVFFVNKTMDETESRYLPLEKAALALIQAAKKLPHYFQASTVTVLIDLPLKMLMHSSDFSGRITREREKVQSRPILQAHMLTEGSSEWKLFVDGASNMKGAGAGVCAISTEASWMDPLIAYLWDDCLPQDPKAANVIKRKASRSMKEYVEATLGESAINVRGFAPKIHQPARELNPLSSPWPFAQWGLDIVGPLPRAPGNKKFLIVATDYFSKWVEAEPLSHIREVETKRFLWKSIITRFGIPWAVISDNGTQFKGKLFKGFCSELGIRNFFSSPGYPQSNGQAEVSNKVILDDIKKRLEEAKGRWVEELPSVMWTHRTTKRRSTGETPFALAYGVEAVIPLEVGLPTTRTTEFDVEENESSLRMDLNLVEERRDMATIRLASYQHQMKRGYDKNIRPRSFQVGDLVLRKVMANT